MRKKGAFGALILSFLLLAGCGKADPPADSAVSDPEREAPAPLLLEELSLEIPRGTLDAQTLGSIVKALPEALKTALEAYGVRAETVSVTVGSSPASTAQAVSEGGVDLALIAGNDCVSLPVIPTAIAAAGAWDPALGDDPEVWNGDLAGNTAVGPGEHLLLCAAPSEYGRNLAGRNNLTEEELFRARWGVLPEGDLVGHQAVTLWLSDHYEGLTLADMPAVSVYADAEALLRAAAAGEIDLLPMTAFLRAAWSAPWTTPADQFAMQGAVKGFGREVSLYEELPVLAVSGCFYDTVVLAAEGEALTDPQFSAALVNALCDLQQSGFADVFGTAYYGVINNSDLDPMRRIAVLFGE